MSGGAGRGSAMPGDSAPSFERDVKSLFKEGDRKAMSFAFDLWSYQEVRNNAEGILDQLVTGRMPCYGAWPEEQIALFRAWIETGMRA
jgi:hypothetical protein